MSAPFSRLLASALVGLAVALAACGGDEGEEATTTTNAATEAGCEAVEAPAAKDVELKKPSDQLPAGQKLTAVVETSCGSFEIALDSRTSPKTVSSFVHMAEEGLYDGTMFDRIVPGFVIQGGDPSGGQGAGPGYFVDEPPPADTEYTRGTVAMAKRAVDPPGRSQSAFFVVTAADAGIRPDFALLGIVARGQGVVDRIGALGDPASGEDGIPLATVLLEGVTIDRG